MGTIGLDNARLAAFQSDIYPRGLDLGRCVILQDLGVFRAATAAEFEAGMLVAQDANGEIVKCAGRPVLGVAKWNKVNAYTAPVVFEAISFPLAGAAVSLAHPNVSNFKLTDTATIPAGTVYADPGDYSLNATNGVVTHNGAGTIPVATTVYVSYTYELSSRDLDFQGRNFFNFLDDVSIADQRVTVITDASVLFTTMYDTSRDDYALTGTGKNLYCGGGVTAALAGLFTTDPLEGEFVGHVIQIPTADDPFLGIRLGGDPVVVP